MAIDGKEIETLIKMLGMTTSDNDHQALVAIRAANRALLRAGTDWSSLLRGKLTILGDPFVGMSAPEPQRAAPPPPPRPQAPAAPIPPQPFMQQPPSWWQTRARPAMTKPIRNRFNDTCDQCRRFIPAGTGWSIRNATSDLWTIKCDSCQYPIAQPAGAKPNRPQPGTPMKKRGQAKIDDLLI